MSEHAYDGKYASDRRPSPVRHDPPGHLGALSVDDLPDRFALRLVGALVDDHLLPAVALCDLARPLKEKYPVEAVESGAELVTGGKREGAIYHPTVLTHTKPQMKVNCLEVFGPVVTVEPYRELEQAFESVNDSAFGLQAGIFTNDNRALFQAFEKLEVGGVVANDVPTFRADHMPYGGAKDSGTGREGARYAIEEMTERKILVLNLD